MNSLETIVFDVDDTLYDQAMTFKNTCRKMIDIVFTEDELNDFYMISRKYSDAYFELCEAGELTVKEMRIRRIKDAAAEIGIVMSDQDAIDFQHAYVSEQQKIELFDEIEQLLTFLYNEGKQIAVLTNGPTEHQSMKIKQLGLEKWIPKEHTFISESIGYAKPLENAFQIIEEQLNLNKEKTVYIGDSFTNDIVGAKQVGWKAVWMNHRRRGLPSHSVKPDQTVFSADELLQLFVK